MKKTVKGIVLVLLICMISSVIAAGNGNLTVKQAIEIAKTGNELQEELKDIQIQEYKILYDEAVRKIPTTSITTYSSCYSRYVTPIVTEKVYELAKMQKEDANRLLDLNVYKQAIGLIYSYKNIEYYEKLLTIDKQKEQRAYANYKVNQISYESYLSYTYTVENRKDSIQDLKYALEKKNMDFKILLNLPVSSEDLVIEETEFTYVTPDNIDLEKVIKDVIDSDSNMYSRTMDIKIQEKLMEITQEFYEEDQVNYWQNQYNYKNAIYNENVTKVNIEYNIRVAYNNLLTRYNKIKLAKMYEDIKRKDMETAYAKYQKQIINWDSYIGTVTAYYSAQFSTLGAEYNYMVAKADFDFLIGK